MSGNNDDEKLPDVARRRGNADTLFSADWFDDEEEEAAGSSDAATDVEKAPEISAPAMYQPPAPEVKPSAPPAAPPPPPRARRSNPTILPDFDLEDDEELEPPKPAEPAPPPAPPVAASPSPNPEAPADPPAEDALPDIAKRRGNADTLFSADWFDDDAADGKDDDADAPAPKPAAAPKAPPTSAPIASPVTPAEPAAGPNRTMIYVGVAVGLLVLACAGVGTGVLLVALLK